MNGTQTKIISLIIIEIIALSLLFTGIFTVLSKNNQSLSNIRSLKSSSEILSLATSDNYIYVLTPSNQNKISLIKYDSNLKQIWEFSYNYSNLYSNSINLNILAANDQNVLIQLTTFKLYPHEFLLIVNQNGIQAKFDLNNFTPVLLAYSFYSFLPLGNNYFIAAEKAINNSIQIAGYSLKSDNTTQSLFYRNFNDRMYITYSFYKDSNTIEIPYDTLAVNTTNNSYYTNSSYFLEYNINTKSLIQKPSNNASVLNKLNKVRSLVNGSLYTTSFPFIYNQNYIGLVLSIYNNQTIFKIWSNSNLLTETPFNLFSTSKLNPSISISAIPMLPFQIGSRCYINFIFENTQPPYNEMPVLLLYTKYSLYSNLQVLEYPNLHTSNESLVLDGSTHLNGIFVLYGEILPKSGNNYYFIKLYALRFSFLDSIFNLPLWIKFLIGLIFILPPVWYLIKKSKSLTSTRDTYPLYKE